VSEQSSFFVLEHLQRFFPCFAMDAHIGDVGQPVLSGRIDGMKIRQLEPGQEIFLYIGDAAFHASFPLPLRTPQGRW